MKISIQGAEYPFPGFDTLKYGEASIIKAQTGLRMGEFFEALETGDTDALLAIALVGKLRVDATLRDDGTYDPVVVKQISGALKALMLSDIEIIVEPADMVDMPGDDSPKAEEGAVAEALPSTESSSSQS